MAIVGVPWLPVLLSSTRSIEAQSSSDRVFWSESDIIDLQDGRGVCAGLAAGVGIPSEVDPVCRNDPPQLGEPSGLGELACETLLEHADSDEGCGRCTWRGAEQGDKGFVRGCDQLGSELQYATPLLIRLNDLHALSGDRFAPILSSSLGKEL